MAKMNKKEQVIRELLCMANGAHDIEFSDWSFYNWLLKRFVDELPFSEVCELILKLIDDGVYQSEADAIVDAVSETFVGGGAEFLD